jgi:hypothetical protein
VKHGLDVQEAMLRSGTPEVGAPGWAQEPPDAWGHLHAEAGATPVPTEPGSYERFYALVADALARGTAMPVQLEEPIAGLQLIEAAQRSARQHAVVGVDPAP